MLAFSFIVLVVAQSVGSCAGDLNGDRSVDGRDLNVLLAQYGDTNPCEPSAEALAIADPEEREAVCALECMNDRPQADLNDDRIVDGFDLTVLLSTFGCREF